MKNTRSRLLSILIVGILIIGNMSCEDNSSCCASIDTDVYFQYKNESGENLINSNDDFSESKIKIYYKNGNEFEYMYKSNLDSPKMYDLSDSDGDLILKVYTSYYYEGNLSTTLIELNPNTVDTLVCEYKLENGNESILKSWLNGVEMDERFFEIVK